MKPTDACSIVGRVKHLSLRTVAYAAGGRRSASVYARERGTPGRSFARDKTYKIHSSLTYLYKLLQHSAPSSEPSGQSVVPSQNFSTLRHFDVALQANWFGGQFREPYVVLTTFNFQCFSFNLKWMLVHRNIFRRFHPDNRRHLWIFLYF